MHAYSLCILYYYELQEVTWKCTLHYVYNLWYLFIYSRYEYKSDAGKEFRILAVLEDIWAYQNKNFHLEVADIK